MELPATECAPRAHIAKELTGESRPLEGGLDLVAKQTTALFIADLKLCAETGQLSKTLWILMRSIASQIPISTQEVEGCNNFILSEAQNRSLSDADRWASPEPVVQQNMLAKAELVWPHSSRALRGKGSAWAQAQTVLIRKLLSNIGSALVCISFCDKVLLAHSFKAGALFLECTQSDGDIGDLHLTPFKFVSLAAAIQETWDDALLTKAYEPTSRARRYKELVQQHTIFHHDVRVIGASHHL